MSSNFDPYQTPSTSLGAMSGGQSMASFGVDNDTDGDDSDSKNSQSYKERRFVSDFLPSLLARWRNVL